MEYSYLLPIIFLSTVLIYFYVPLVGIYRYYKPLEHKIWANLLWIIFSVFTWPIVPIVMVIRRKDVFLTRIFWVAFVIWLFAFGFFITQNTENMIEIFNNYSNVMSKEVIVVQ
jgi:hypothetical protein